MHRQQPPPRIPNIKFRVLIIGRANAGKTSILQRVCDTTDSPIIYRGKEKITLEPSVDRGEHTIDDELVFSSHTEYIFHDSRGIESASTYELGILQSFIQRKCGERRLGDRLHAIWYCVPMDNQRPQLDLRFFKDICPDQNVPVIAVFTKYDQFRKNIRINVEDFGSPDDDVSQVTEEHFQEYYLRPLGDDVRFVRLEKMHMQDMRCDELIETTAVSLNEETTALMLLAVQRGNLELSVKTALKRVDSHTSNDSEVKHIVRECLIPFPFLWLFSLSEVSGCGAWLRFKPADDASPRPPRKKNCSLNSCLKDLRESLWNSSLDSDCSKRGENILCHCPPLQISPPPVLIAIIWPLVLIRFIISTVHLTLIEAVIIISKHATSLRFSNLSFESALTHAELDYREANIDSKIQHYLAASSSQEHSVGLFASFIMATDMSSVKNTSAQTRSCLNYSETQYSPSILYSYWN